MNINFGNEEYVVPFFGKLYLNLSGGDNRTPAPVEETNVMLSKEQREFLEGNECYMTVFSMPLMSFIRMSSVSDDIENLMLSVLTHFGRIKTSEMVYFGVLSPKQADSVYFFINKGKYAVNLHACVSNVLDLSDTDLKAPENRGMVTLPYTDLGTVLSIGLQYCANQERLRFHRSFLANATEGKLDMKNKYVKQVLKGLKKITSEVREQAAEEYEAANQFPTDRVTVEGMDGIELDPIPEPLLDRIFNMPATHGRCSTVTTASGKQFLVPQLDEGETGEECDDDEHASLTQSAMKNARRTLDANDDYDDEDEDDEEDDIYDEDENYPYKDEEDEFEASLHEWHATEADVSVLDSIICMLDMDDCMDLPEDYSPREFKEFLKKRGLNAYTVIRKLREELRKQLGLK